MKQVPGDYFAEIDDREAAMAMDVDDVDPLEMFAEGMLTPESSKLVDADFFNSFEDDFDDTDIN